MLYGFIAWQQIFLTIFSEFLCQFINYLAVISALQNVFFTFEKR